MTGTTEQGDDTTDDGHDAVSLVTSRLIEIYNVELRSFAQRLMAGERIGHTLQPTALLNEAWLKLGSLGRQQEWVSRGHFFGAMAHAMRQVLVDHARKSTCIKRGGNNRREQLTADIDVAAPTPSDEVLAINEALHKLERVDKAGAMLVTLRFFADFTHAEAAEEMGISESTAKRGLDHAKKLLIVFLAEDDREWLNRV